MSVDETAYNTALASLNTSITNYDNFNSRTAPLSFTSMTTKLTADRTAAVSEGLTQVFIDGQTTLINKYIKTVDDYLNFELESSIIPFSDKL